MAEQRAWNLDRGGAGSKVEGPRSKVGGRMLAWASAFVGELRRDKPRRRRRQSDYDFPGGFPKVGSRDCGANRPWAKLRNRLRGFQSGAALRFQAFRRFWTVSVHGRPE